jgi:hypothetical protein
MIGVLSEHRRSSTKAANEKKTLGAAGETIVGAGGWSSVQREGKGGRAGSGCGCARRRRKGVNQRRGWSTEAGVRWDIRAKGVKVG